MPKFGFLTTDVVRLSFLYASAMIVGGVQMPFWPIWLAHRGIGAAEIGLLMSIPYWAKVLTNPLFGSHVDRKGRTKPTVILIAVGVFALGLNYLWADSFAPIFAVMIFTAFLYGATNPLLDAMAMTLTVAGKADYGRLRLWGSLSFVAMSIFCGHMIEINGPETALILYLVCAAIFVAGAVQAPDIPPRSRDGASASLALLFRDAGFILFLIAITLINSSHALYYGFSSLYWKDSGISETTVGVLWAIGVISEIAVFSMSGKIVSRLGPARLLLLGACGAVIRWTMLGITTDVVTLVIVQTLHGISFGIAHIGAMHYIARAVKPGMSARAQTIYNAIGTGLIPGAMMFASGPLYAAMGGKAFLVMALLAAVSAVVAAILRYRRIRTAQSS